MNFKIVLNTVIHFFPVMLEKMCRVHNAKELLPFRPDLNLESVHEDELEVRRLWGL